MHYKIKGAIKKNKDRFIIFIILWIIMAIALVAPIAYAQNRATVDGVFDFGKCITELMTAYTNFGDVMGSFGIYVSEFFGLLWKFTLVYLIFMFVGFVRTAPKNEYTDIEQGSSDWASGGEQYKVLSRHKGIILAENNYLPVDKRGNVNVLVVGRFRFW